MYVLDARLVFMVISFTVLNSQVIFTLETDNINLCVQKMNTHWRGTIRKIAHFNWLKSLCRFLSERGRKILLFLIEGEKLILSERTLLVNIQIKKCIVSFYETNVLFLFSFSIMDPCYLY